MGAALMAAQWDLIRQARRAQTAYESCGLTPPGELAVLLRSLPGGRAEDLTGRCYGRLTVLGRAFDRPDAKLWRWLCRCGGCGDERPYWSTNLVSGAQCQACHLAAINAPGGAADAGRRAEKQRPERACAGCGKAFPGHAQQRYCCAACRPSGQMTRRERRLARGRIADE